jgi:hypothetical protein
MAEIVKARNSRASSEPTLAIKRILPHLVEDRQFVTMFLDESRVLQQLEHDQIIHTFEVGDVEGTPYIALEYVYGQDARMLFHRARRNDENLSLPLGCYIIAQVCAGLHYAHEQTDAQGSLLGLVHRDMSLQNILLSYEGEVKIIDFGIAMSAENRARTEAGIVKGKFGYMSPEQIRGEVLDRRSDVFAVGICLYELLTNERLFSGDSDYAAIQRVRNVDVQPPSSFNRQIPSSLERIVMKALAKNPRDRYQTANEMRRALLAFMTDSHNECSARELADYMRKAFADEIKKQPSADAVVAGMGAAGSKDEGTGLAAFDDLDPVSMLTAMEDQAPEPEPVRQPIAQPRREPTPTPAPMRRDPTPTPAPMRRDATPTPMPASAAPSVPRLVPRPQSIPGFAVALPTPTPTPTPAGHAPEWADEDPVTSPGLLAGVEALPDADDNEVTRQINIHKTFPGLAFGSSPGMQSAAGGAGPQSAPQHVAGTSNSGTFPVRASYPPTAAAAPASPAAAVASTAMSTQPPTTVAGAKPSQPYNVVAVLGVVGAIVAAIVVGLYLTKPPEPGTIHLSTQPKDVRVLVDGKPVENSLSPFVLAELEPEVDHTIAVDKDGYRPWSTRLSVRPGQTLQLPVVSLESVEPAPVAAAAEAPAQPAVAPPAGPVVRRTEAPSGSTPAVTPTRERAPASDAPRTRSTAERPAATATRPPAGADKPTQSATRQPVAKAAAPAAGMGTLRINTRPWSEISIDGRRAGNTPQMNLQLPAGKHKISLVNKEFGLKQTLTIEIKPGETVTKVITLQ